MNGLSEVTMAAAPRRVGAETSKTRDALLDCVESMMLEEGYASVSYRSLAAKAGVTASLVQYYFPSFDDIFLAAIRRYSERNLELLRQGLQSRSEDPLHAMWEYSWDEASAALMTEFMALGNHRKSIRSEIANVTQRMRKLQIDTLRDKYGPDPRLPGDLSLGAVVLLTTGLPKFLNLERSVGVGTAHADVVAAFERYVDSIEPSAKPRRGKTASRSRRR
jgi:TetR/AcrR family transcriptional regulator, transcriptional repressor for nem operon